MGLCNISAHRLSSPKPDPRTRGVRERGSWTPLDNREARVILLGNMTSGLSDLRRIREAQGYSLRSLADKAGMSYVALFRLETGETDPRLSTLRGLAKALNVTVAELIGEGKPARRRARG